MVIEWAVPAEPGAVGAWFLSAGRAWRRLPRWVQWVLSLGICIGLQSLAAPGGVVFAVLMVLFLGGTDVEATAKRRAKAAVEQRRPRVGSAEAALAESGSIEAMVAAAAYRAWSETLQEPAWSSPALEGRPRVVRRGSRGRHHRRPSPPHRRRPRGTGCEAGRAGWGLLAPADGGA
jgi:hypothetical protein